MQPGDEGRAAVALRSALDAVGYGQMYGGMLEAAHSLGPFARDAAAARGFAASIEGGAVLALLAMGDPVAGIAIPVALAAALAELAAVGLAERAAAGEWRTAGWVVVPHGDGRLLTDVPRHYGGQAVRVYVGPDSLLLAASLPQQPGLRVLDLGAGCGIQGLLAVRAPAAVTLLDIEPRAVRFCAFNAVLNGVQERTLCLEGDLYAPVPGERFDLIVSLPPYLPVPNGLSVSSIAGGGPDGLGVIRQVMAGAADHLTPSGRLVFLCQTLGDGTGPFLARTPQPPGVRWSMELRAGFPAEMLALNMAKELPAREPGLDPATVLERYRESFATLGATQLFTVLVSGVAPAG